MTGGGIIAGVGRGTRPTGTFAPAPNASLPPRRAAGETDAKAHK